MAGFKFDDEKYAGLTSRRWFCRAAALLHTAKAKVRGRLPEEMQEAIDHEASEEDKRHMTALVCDLFYSLYYYKTNYREYFWFGYPKLTDRGRKEYFGWYAYKPYYMEYMRKSGLKDLFNNKDQTYEAFKPFYKREVIKGAPDEDNEAVLRDFLQRHPSFAAKPLASRGGKNVRRMSTTAPDFSFEKLLKAFSEGTLLLEELIEQVPEMAAFHPRSVNTIRFVTFLKEDRVIPVIAVLRMGAGGSFTDNATSGGVYAMIEPETGIIRDLARDEACITYLRHPDTGVVLPGHKIPQWEELLATVEKLARVRPEQVLAGWDLALTDKGWVMVEANIRPALQLFEPQRGIRKYLLSIFDGE